MNATPGCFHWDSSNDDCVRVVPIPTQACELWEGASSIADLITPKAPSKPTGPVSCKVRATPVYLGDGADPDCGDLITDVYVAPLARLEILTTARKIGVDEAERISVQAFDDQGNIFSTLENVRFAWSVSPPSMNGPLRLGAERASGQDNVDDESGLDPALAMELDGVDVAGQRSGYAEVSVRLQEGSRVGGDAAGLQSSAVISVVETLRLCPTPLVSPLLVQVGTEVTFTSYIDRSTVSLHAKDCHDDRRIQEEHRQEAMKGKYVWKEDSAGVIGTVSQRGVFSGQSEGKLELTLQEKDFPPNHVAMTVRVVQARELFLVMSANVVRPANDLCPSESLPLWLRSQAKMKRGESAVAVQSETREWLMVRDRDYYIVTIPLAQATKTNTLFEVIRHAVFIADPLRFALAEKEDQELLTIGTQGQLPNVVKVTPKQTGTTRLFATLSIETVLAKADQAVRIVPKVMVKDAILRLPLRHTYAIEMQGGTGEFRFARHTCSEDIIKIDNSGKLWSLNVEGRCELLGCDRQDSSNCAEIKVIVSQPSRLFVRDERMPYHMPLGAQETLFLEARDMDNERYTVCGELKITYQPMDQVGLNLEPSADPDTCGKLTLAARAPGYSSPRLWVEGGGASHELSVHVHQPLAIISPPVRAPHNLPTAVVRVGDSDVMEVEGGREDDTRLSLREEAVDDTHAVELPSNAVRTQPGISRSFQISCTATGRFIIRVASGSEVRDLLLICAEVSSAKVELITVHSPASLVEESEGSLTVTTPGRVDFLVRYFDRSGMEFTAISGENTEWAFAEAKHNQGSELSEDTHVVLAPNGLQCTVSFDEAAVEERELVVQGYEVTARFRLIFFTDPVIRPGVHPPILNIPEARARFRVFGGSGRFSLSCDYGDPERDGREVEIRGSKREAVAHLLAKDEQSHALDPASAEVRIAALHSIRLRASAKRVEVGKNVEISVELLDALGNVFARQSVAQTEISIRRSREGVLTGLVERSLGWLDCASVLHGTTVCAGVWHTNATAATAGQVELSASASVQAGVLATSAVPLTLHVFEPLRLSPAQVTLLPGSKLHLRRLGGPRDMGEKCVFRSDNVENTKVVDAANGGIEAVSPGEVVVECVCVDSETGEEITRASSTISVVTIRTIEVLGDGRLVAGGKTRLQVRGGGGESPLAFHTTEKHFIWSVDDPNVAAVKGDGHSVWLEAAPQQSFSRTIVRLMARFRAADSYISATMPVRVVPRLLLISERHVLMPTNSSIKIQTNLDGEVRLSYTLFSSPPGEGRPCKPVEGVSVVASNGIVKVDGFEQDFVVVITMLDEESEEQSSLEARQTVYVYVQVRHVVALALEMDQTTLGLNEAVDGQVVMVDNRGFAFSDLHTYPELGFFDAIQGVLHVTHRRHSNRVTVRGLREGQTILRVDIPAYKALSIYQVEMHGYTGPTDFVDLVVADGAKASVYRSPLVALQDRATSSWAAMDPKDSALMAVSATAAFIILWLLCIPRLSGNTAKTDEYSYNMMHPNARMPGRR